MWMPLLIVLSLAQEPTYEKEIAEKNKVNSETKAQDQKSFFEVINAKTQEVVRYAREKKSELVKKQEVVRKDFEAKLKAEINEVKKKDPKASVEPLRKAANEKRRELIEQLNTEKRTLEKQMDEFKDRFQSFVKVQKENFREQMTVLSARVKSEIKKAQEPTPAQQEFSDIPPGPATPLKPQ